MLFSEYIAYNLPVPIKRGFYILMLFFFFNIYCFGQKKKLENDSYKEWTSVSDGTLSSNGKYAFYLTENRPVGSSTYTVVSTDLKWKKTFLSATTLNFTSDSKKLMLIQNDTLKQITLGKDKAEIITNCKNYQLITIGENTYLVYQLGDPRNTIVIKDIANRAKIRIEYVDSFILNQKASELIINVVDKKLIKVVKLNLRSRIKSVIYTGQAPSNYIFDYSGKKIAFTDVDKNGLKIWYSQGDEKVELIGDEKKMNLIPGYQLDISKYWRFNSSGTGLFFTQSAPLAVKSLNDPVVWSYKDAYLNSRYIGLGANKTQIGENFSMLDIESKHVKHILSSSQKIISDIEANSKLLVVSSAFGDPSERDWNKYAKQDILLCSTLTGKLTKVETECNGNNDFHLSPDGKYLFYYDNCLRGYYTYYVSTGQTKKVAGNITELVRGDDIFLTDRFPAEFLGWTENTNHVILRGKYDIYEIDLNKENALVNLTLGVGERKKIEFNFRCFNLHGIVETKKNILLVGYNKINKENVLYMLDYSNRELSLIFPRTSTSSINYKSDEQLMPNQTLGKSGYLFRSMSASRSPNYYYTKDFKEFLQISSETPEERFKWLTAELITYKGDGGNTTYDAIIYKPEDFDPRKKYPVIFFYYRYLSKQLYTYIPPTPKFNGVNIPLLVSKGFVVVCPDIKLAMGQPGEGPLKSIMAAADLMVSKTWVDPARMGIVGHSLGGFETNYIATHTSRFRAAISLASISNMIHQYNDIWPGTGVPFSQYAKNTMGFGKSLDADPDIYIKNSPILKVKDITTPMLLMHNLNDTQVNYSQSLQLFIQMRSLSKPVWLVQYPGEGHMLLNTRNQIDFQDKVGQFFDYYLLDKQMPQWMHDHISPAKTE